LTAAEAEALLLLCGWEEEAVEGAAVLTERELSLADADEEVCEDFLLLSPEEEAVLKGFLSAEKAETAVNNAHMKSNNIFFIFPPLVCAYIGKTTFESLKILLKSMRAADKRL
jgi:hypothetical protein